MLERQVQWKLLDNYRRQNFIRFELKRLVLKSLLKNQSIPLSNRYMASLQLSLLPSISGATKHRNRCVESGRKWNVLKKTQYSRFIFRRESYKGSLPGVSRMSW